MENHINQLSPRALSLYGKVILLSTLTMSKTSNLSIVSPLDNKATLKIHQKIFRYLWRDQKVDLYNQENNFLFLQKIKKKKKKWSTKSIRTIILL